jgi:hypothetical protein
VPKFTASWTENDLVKSVELLSAAGALSLLDELDARLGVGPSMLEILNGEPGSAIAIGTGRPETIVTWQGGFDPPFYISSGESTRPGVVSFRFGGEASEYLATHLIPKSNGRQALIDYLNDGRRSTLIDWEAS